MRLTRPPRWSIPIYGSSLTFAGRDWTVIVRPTPKFLAAALKGAGWSELASGLLLTVLFSVYLVSSRTRADRLRLLAENLRQEVAVRRAAEETQKPRAEPRRVLAI